MAPSEAPGRSQPTGCHRDPASTQRLRPEGLDRGSEIPSTCYKRLAKRSSFTIFTRGAAPAPSPGQYLHTAQGAAGLTLLCRGLSPAWGLLLGLAPEGQGGGSAVLPTATDRPQGIRRDQGQGPRPRGTQDGGASLQLRRVLLPIPLCLRPGSSPVLCGPHTGTRPGTRS